MKGSAPPEWLDYLMDEEWFALCEFLEVASNARIPILLGGGMGLSAYMPLRRRTKDIDFYVHPRDREHIVARLTAIGFHDIHAQKPYDQRWIYRSARGEVIIDIIWRFANMLSEVDDEWFRRARRLPLAGREIAVVPAEELLRAKLFVVQRERCDWPDLLNLLYHTAPQLDFTYLRERLGPHEALLDGLLSIYRWLCPDGGPPPEDETPSRPDLLDLRPWFLSKRP